MAVIESKCFPELRFVRLGEVSTEFQRHTAAWIIVEGLDSFLVLSSSDG